MKRRRWGIAGIWAGLVLIAGAVIFRTVAVPALVRFSLNVDETATHTGTASTYVDQATLLPLPVPQREPLTLSRHVKVAEGSFDKAVVDEAVEMKVGSTTMTEEYQYVMDRRTMTLGNDRLCTWEPELVTCTTTGPAGTSRHGRRDLEVRPA
jgi:hypothetical protein